MLHFSPLNELFRSLFTDYGLDEIVVNLRWRVDDIDFCCQSDLKGVMNKNCDAQSLGFRII